MARSSRGAGRGGERSGAPGADYPNRTDLQLGPRLAPAAPTGLPYGEHQELIQAQQQVPLRGEAGPAPMSAPGLPQPSNSLFSAPAVMEHTTSGLDSGPGPGSEVMGPLSPQGMQPTLGGLLFHLAQQPGASTAVKQLADAASTGRQ